MNMIISNMVALDGNTAIRANVIAKRTHSKELGAMKALMIETLKAKMVNGIAHFLYVKKNGELREAFGTIQPQLVALKVNGRGESREWHNTTAYFDVECGAWRSFCWESLIKVF